MSASFQEVALLLYYHKLNRYSFNALVGAIETHESLNQLPIFFAKNPEGLTNQLGKLNAKFDQIIVAFSIMTFQVPKIWRLVSFLRKKIASKVVFIAGGPHPTGDPVGTLGLGFDVVVRGEGEETFPEIVKKIVIGADYRLMKGIAFYDGKDYVINPPAKRLDINYYPPFAAKHKKFGPIEISRGCPWTCRFCQTPYIFSVKVRHRSVPNICKYVKIMKEEGLTDIRFISPNAFMYGSTGGKSVNAEAIEELLRSVREVLGSKGRIFFGTFPSEVRPESVAPKIIKLIKKYCNNDNLVIGAQSGSERILDYICRGHGVEEIRKAVRLTLQSGFKANVDFIFGLPDETEKDVRLTLRLITELTGMGARIHAHTFMPLVGTPFKDMPPGRIKPKVRKELERLISKGKLYGQWRTQELIARSVNELRRKGIIQDSAKKPK